VRAWDRAARKRASSGAALRSPHLGEEHRELIAPTRQSSRGCATSVSEKLGHPRMNQIPVLVAVAVVEHLEIIDIDHHDAEVALRLATARLQFLGETLDVSSAIPQSG